MTESLSLLVALSALAFSFWTWRAQRLHEERESKRADVSAMLHWLPNPAHVTLPDGNRVDVWYSLVLINRGPADARSVTVSVTNRDGQALDLTDVGPDEMPISILPASGRYPIPFSYTPFASGERRFTVTLTWTDDNGPREHLLPLRRGHLPV